MDERWGTRKESAVVDEVFRAECRAHYDKLQRVPFARSGHLSPERNNAGQHTCSAAHIGVFALLLQLVK